MKRIPMLMMLFVLTAALMTGCGCTGPTMDQTEMPTVLPTNEEVMPTSHPTTQPAAEPTSQPTTMPTAATEPYDNGNGPIDPTMDTAPTESTAAGRAKIR